MPMMETYAAVANSCSFIQCFFLFFFVFIYLFALITNKHSCFPRILVVLPLFSSSCEQLCFEAPKKVWFLGLSFFYDHLLTV
jgi:hypothetical protein